MIINICSKVNVEVKKMDLVVEKIQKFAPRLWILPEFTQHAACHRLAVDLLHAPHHHAHVWGLHNNANTSWLHGLHYSLQKITFIY